MRLMGTVCGSAVVCLALSCGAELVQTGRVQAWTNCHGNAWARDSGTITCRDVGDCRYEVRHTGTQDWSFNGLPTLKVKSGEEYVLTCESAAVPGVTNAGVFVPSVVIRKSGVAVDWGFAGVDTEPGKSYRRTFLVPDGITEMQPRVMGRRPFAGVVGPVVLTATGRRELDRLPTTNRLSSAALEVAVETTTGFFSVTDRRTGRTWTPQKLPDVGLGYGWRPLSATTLKDGSLELEFYRPDDLSKHGRVVFEIEGNELVVTLDLAHDTPLWNTLRYPAPFATRKGERLLVPRNEGLGYPVDEENEGLRSGSIYSGYWTSMPFFGVVDDATGAGMALITETDDDASHEVYRAAEDDRLWSMGAGWHAEFGVFGYARRVRYVFLDRGGHVAVCKRFRAYAASKGWVKTFEEKAIRRPRVKRLPGAPNIWYFGAKRRQIGRELLELGVTHFLWSGGGSEEDVKFFAEQPDVLVSRYDNTQDVFYPELLARMYVTSPRAYSEAWPDDVMWTGSTPESWRRAWGIEIKTPGPDGTNVVEMMHCATMCDVKAPFYLREEVRKDLKTKPFNTRFMDTTMAEPWKECAHPRHRQTRRESHAWKLELMRLLGDEFGLVTGSERGSASGVPVCDYYEGMMSLAGYGLPRAGRDMAITWTNEIPHACAKFVVNPRYRLPLWELVFHDCCCAHWYWGDTQNKAPALWEGRTLMNILYATAPVFLFTDQQWPLIRQRLAETCRTVEPIARAAGFSEMTDHRLLTPDRLVQQTVFANGLRITVNFGEQPFTLPDGTTVPPRGHVVQR